MAPSAAEQAVRPQAPAAARQCPVIDSRDTGGYRVFTVRDGEGPMPRAGQFYMLSTATGWGGAEGRPYLGRAFSVAAARPEDDGIALDFLLEAVGPGTRRLATLAAGDAATLVGPLGLPFSMPPELGEDVAGAILVGGGIGIAPIAILRTELVAAGIPSRTLLGFRDRAHSGGTELFDCSEVRLASEDGHAGHRGYVTDLLEQVLAGDSAGTAAVYACGPPAMLEAVRVLCAGPGVPAELAMEAPMACGFGACFGCAVPLADGSLVRLCVEGPVLRADRLSTALVPGSGH